MYRFLIYQGFNIATLKSNDEVVELPWCHKDFKTDLQQLLDRGIDLPPAHPNSDLNCTVQEAGHKLAANIAQLYERMYKVQVRRNDDHCPHGQGDTIICCWCGNLMLSRYIKEQHGPHLPKHGTI